MDKKEKQQLPRLNPSTKAQDFTIESKKAELNKTAIPFKEKFI